MADITTYSRDEHRDRYLRFFKLRSPTSDTGPGGEPYALASADADTAMVLYGDAITIARNINLLDSTGEDLLRKAQARGIDGKRPATGAQGFVVVVAAVGGGTITEGTELRHKASGLRFECSVTDVYTSGSLCPIRGVDTGTETNLEEGTILEWTSPPPGIGDTASAYLDLQGGYPEESDEELIGRIIELQKEPPASGNDASIRKAARETPDVPVEEAWSYPAIFGPGTTAVVATLRRSSLLASRLPNAAQLAAIEANVKAQVPFDDGIFLCTLQEDAVDVFIQVTWAKQTAGWADGLVTWPVYDATDVVRVSSAASPTAFTLTSTVSTTDPQVGQTIGFYDPVAGRFRRKRLKTVEVATPGEEWDIVCDTASNASDTSFTPAVGAAASPWSDSLDSMVTPLLAYFATMGPGEQVDPLPDPGLRQRRQPPSPDSFPNIITNRDLVGAFPRSIVSDVAAGESMNLPATTAVGTPGTLSYLHVLGDFGVYAQ